MLGSRNCLPNLLHKLTPSPEWCRHCDMDGFWYWVSCMVGSIKTNPVDLDPCQCYEEWGDFVGPPTPQDQSDWEMCFS